MAAATTKISRKMPCFLMLLSLPFAAVGISSTVAAMRTTWKAAAMKEWVEVPATITRADLRRIQGEDDITYQAIATYEYDFGGRHYTGHRVSLHSGSDSIGSFQHDAYRELTRHLDQRRPFHCYVDPRNPVEAVLYRQLRWEKQAFTTGFATTFGSAGLAILIASLAGWREVRKSSASEAPSDAPWLARRDWAAGQIEEDTTQVASIVLAVVAMYWNVAILPLVVTLPSILSQRTSHWVWLTLAFPAIGVALVAAWAYLWARRRKFGVSHFQMTTVPGIVGGQLAGVVQIPSKVSAIDGFHLKLSCIDNTPDSDGDSKNKVIWQDERLVTDTLGGATQYETTVSVLFAIPFESPETSRSESTRSIEWQLQVRARLPGVDYSSHFEVPVFKIAASQSDFRLDDKLAADFSNAPDADSLLRAARVIKSPLPGRGVRLDFLPARNWTMALTLTIVLAAWSGFVWLMVHFDAPILAPIVFGLFGLLLLYGVLDLWFHRSVVEANSDGLTARNRLLGTGRTRTFAADEIELIETTEHMSFGTHVWKNIAVVNRDGKKRTIAKGIGSRLVERAVIDELNAALGRTA